MTQNQNIKEQELNLGQQLEKIINDLKAANIAIIGRTGVGKSTLINKVFGITDAKTGRGEPVTNNFLRYPNHTNSSVYIYDSAGYDSGDSENFINNLSDFFSNLKNKPFEEHIHCVWYIVNASSARFTQDFDKIIIDNINSQDIPVIIILSQCDRAREDEVNEIAKVIEKCHFKKAYDLIKVSAEPLEINNVPICEPFGLDSLVNRTTDLLPQFCSEAFIIAQIISIESKRKIAMTYVATASTSCFGIVFVPLPVVSVSRILIENTLFDRLASIYDIDNLSELKNIDNKNKRLKDIAITISLELGSMLIPFGNVGAGAASAGHMMSTGMSLVEAFEVTAKAKIYDSEVDIEKVFRETFDREMKRHAKIKIESEEDVEKSKNLFLKRYLSEEV